jgi:hypothetical protein
MDLHQLTTIFCELDDFCKEFDKQIDARALPTTTIKNKRGPECCLSDSEIMTILIMFQSSRVRDFKNFYLLSLSVFYKDLFPKLPSYTRFISIMNRAILPLIFFIQSKSGERTGLYYTDSSCLPTCHIKRSRRHKTFRGISEYGRTSVDWFFGLKLHIVINHQGQLINFKITKGARSDCKEVETLVSSLQGLLFGDKGYISKKLFHTLFSNGLKLITRQRKNMKQKIILNDHEKQLLDQRGIIETVIGHLKHHFQIWHTRHRSPLNAMTHLISSLAAYVIEPLKLSAIKMIAGCS